MLADLRCIGLTDGGRRTEDGGKADLRGMGLTTEFGENPLSAIAIALGPERRTILRAAGAGALAIAAMVSPGSSASGCLWATIAPFSAHLLPPPRLRPGSVSLAIAIAVVAVVAIAIIGDLAVGGVFASFIEDTRPELRECTGRLGFLAVAFAIVFTAAALAVLRTAKPKERAFLD
jgi:hypothetical protein